MSDCIALDYLNKISSKYPGCWEQFDTFLEGKAQGEFEWDDRCYLPIAAGIAVASNGGTPSQSHISDASSLVALAPWRLYKQIYEFAPEMEQLLAEQADDCIIPIEVLNSLPYQSIYIKTSLFRGYDGFFVHFESDPNDGRLELRFLIIDDNLGAVPLAIHLIPGGTIKDGFDAMLAESKKQAGLNRGELLLKQLEKLQEETKMLYDMSLVLMQLVLYICAQNAEIQEDEQQKKITRIPVRKEFIKDKFREVKKYEVGTETARIVRGIYGKSGVGFNYIKGENQGSAKRPHSRRGHWHHFWTGSRENGKERKLILKWVAPTFIHADTPDNVVKINEIKSKPDKNDE